MSEDEEVLDDYMVGAYRAEHTTDWSVIGGIAPKIPPSYDGTTSWFKMLSQIQAATTLRRRYSLPSNLNDTMMSPHKHHSK